MDYKKLEIAPLSKTQISKLLKGLPVIVKHGKGLTLDLSKEQKDKVMKAYKNNKGCKITFDPYQAGQGVGQILHKLKKTASKLTPITRALIPKDIRDTLSKGAEDVTKAVKSVKKSQLQDIGVKALKGVSNYAIPAVLNAVGAEIGMPMLGTVAGPIINPIIDKQIEKINSKKGGNLLDSARKLVRGKTGKSMVEAGVDLGHKHGFGMECKKGRGRPKKGSALLPAGYGSVYGSALLPM